MIKEMENQLRKKFIKRKFTNEVTAKAAIFISPLILFGGYLLFWNGTKIKAETDTIGKIKLTQVTHTLTAETEPSVSPGLNLVSYVHKEKYLSGDIWIKSLDGNITKRITKGRLIPPPDFIPYSYGVRWSKQSKSFLYVSSHTGNYDVFLYEDGQDLNISENPSWDGSPTWSPEETKIAFVSARDRNAEIYLVDCQKEKITIRNIKRCPIVRITNNNVSDIFPIFVSENEIIYTSYVNGRYNLHLIKIEKEPESRILFGLDQDERFTSLSPSREKIAFFCGNEICIAKLKDIRENKTNLLRIKVPDGLLILPNGPQWINDTEIAVISLDEKRSINIIKMTEENKPQIIKLHTELIQNYFLDARWKILAVAAFKSEKSTTYDDIYLLEILE